MSKMDVFNLIAGCASILSLLISIFVATSVINIRNNIHFGDTNKVKNSIKRTQMENSTINQGVNNTGDKR